MDPRYATINGASTPSRRTRTAATQAIAALAGVGVLLAGIPASAHHSDAAFDTEKVIAFRGTVERFAWKNPHVAITVAVDDGSGSTSTWELETGSTPILSRSGWTSQSLQVGDLVTIRAHPARTADRRYAMLLTAEKADGTVLSQMPAETTPMRASGIAGVWRGREESLGPIFEQLGNLSLTNAGMAAKASYVPGRDDPEARCIAPPTPFTLIATVLYLAEFQILEDRIVLRSEFFDVERVIYTDGRGHPENGALTNQGHSIGHWEGDELVVDTALFAPHRTANGEGIPSGSQRHVVERYKLSDDSTRLLVNFRVEDPQFLAEPFSSSLEWEYAPQLKLFRYDCDPEVARRYTLFE